jgi:putative iron-regulated protein
MAKLFIFVLTACGAEPPPTEPPLPTATPGPGVAAVKREVVANYADGVHALYVKSLASATNMDQAIDLFLSDPTASSLEGAKRAWLRARDDYGPTEAFRFYGGPIDNEEDGPEGLINAWPMDEAYIDYVEGDSTAGVVNNPEQFPVIDAALIESMNEEGGEENVSTGWHAIEFLLWGQDLNEIGPGSRPVEDYTTDPNADRRGTYLAVASDLLLVHLKQMVDAWAPGVQDNYRAEFMALDVDTALQNMITGIGELSRGELAGERMTVAYEERSQEDEHSCFSDNTTADIVGNARGIQMVYSGNYGMVAGVGLVDLVSASDQALAEKLSGEIDRSVALAQAIPNPFDAHLRETVPNDDRGRTAVLQTIESLEDQTDTIVAAAQEIGITISVS